MTPAARIQAAIDLLDQIFAGSRPEPALKGWARTNRYAGSGDRAAIRDYVFQAIRRRESCRWMGGGPSGRAVMIGLARQCDWDLDALFSGDRHAPAPLSPEEAAPHDLAGASLQTQLDWPDWLWPEIAHLGEDRNPTCAALRDRAPTFLRVNTLKTDRDGAMRALSEDDIIAEPHPLSETALQVTRNPRRVAQSAAYLSGLVELQDAASQAVIDLCDIQPGESILDYCAGGGGKSLALAARSRNTVQVHDGNPARMKDLPARAQRAGADLQVFDGVDGGFDLVLCDVPCSGSGSWRRDPFGKWALSRAELDERRALQQEILTKAAQFVLPQGRLAYVTCSILECENQSQIETFVAKQNTWTCVKSRQFLPAEGGDGFFLAILTR